MWDHGYAIIDCPLLSEWSSESAQEGFPFCPYSDPFSVDGLEVQLDLPILCVDWQGADPSEHQQHWETLQQKKVLQKATFQCVESNLLSVVGAQI